MDSVTKIKCTQKEMNYNQESVEWLRLKNYFMSFSIKNIEQRVTFCSDYLDYILEYKKRALSVRQSFIKLKYFFLYFLI